MVDTRSRVDGVRVPGTALRFDPADSRFRLVSSDMRKYLLNDHCSKRVSGHTRLSSVLRGRTGYSREVD